MDDIQASLGSPAGIVHTVVASSPIRQRSAAAAPPTLLARYHEPMIEILIPGRGDLHLQHLVLDMNGTLATDGTLIPGVAERVAMLKRQLEVVVVTADTHGGVGRLDPSVRVILTSAHSEDGLAPGARLGLRTASAGVRYAEVLGMFRHPKAVAQSQATATQGDPMNKPSKVVQRKHRKKKGKKVSLRHQ